MILLASAPGLASIGEQVPLYREKKEEDIGKEL